MKASYLLLNAILLVSVNCSFISNNELAVSLDSPSASPLTVIVFNVLRAVYNGIMQGYLKDPLVETQDCFDQKFQDKVIAAINSDVQLILSFSMSFADIIDVYKKAIKLWKDELKSNACAGRTLVNNAEKFMDKYTWIEKTIILYKTFDENFLFFVVLPFN